MQLPEYNEQLPYGGQEPIQEIKNYAKGILFNLVVLACVLALYGIGGLIDRARKLHFIDANSGVIFDDFSVAFFIGMAAFFIFLIINKCENIEKRNRRLCGTQKK